jgi:hypothetical protein
VGTGRGAARRVSGLAARRNARLRGVTRNDQALICKAATWARRTSPSASRCEVAG